jgi:hypothetical protein
MSASQLTIDQLKRALAIEEKIQVLRAELAEILRGGESQDSAPAAAEVTDGRKGKRSAATRAKMAKAQKARWAKLNGTTKVAHVDAPKKKRKTSAEGRARIAEAQRKRWAKAVT